jgi:hypothetical protein
VIWDRRREKSRVDGKIGDLPLMAPGNGINFRAMYCAISSKKLHVTFNGTFMLSPGSFLTSVRGNDSASAAELKTITYDIQRLTDQQMVAQIERMDIR